jgi:hypothetical protein
VADPSRRGQEAAPQDEVENAALPFINIKFFESGGIPIPAAKKLTYPARVLSDEGRFLEAIFQRTE